MVKITQMHVLENHRLILMFDDGKKKNIDFTPFIGEDQLTKPLADPKFFEQVKIYENGRGIYWPNGYDVCPDNLRFHLKADENDVDRRYQKSLQTA
jgi:hypothetical protein